MPADRAATRRIEPALLLLAVSVPILPVLMNPLLSPYSMLLVPAVASAALILAAWNGAPRPGAVAFWLLPFAPLAVASLGSASCRARAHDEAAAAALLVVGGCLGGLLARHGRSGWLTLSLIALGCGASLHAVLQRHVTYPTLAAALRAADPADPTGFLVRLEAGRPSGPFLLPAALGGFLAMAIPVTLAWTAGAGRSRLRIAGLAAAGLEIYALLLTRSLGALAAAATGVLLTIPLLARRRRRLIFAGIVVMAILTGALFVHARRSEIFSGPGADPISLRAGNWSAAARMIRERPVLGVGPGGFESFYPRMMREGMNETRYAHNSYLQAAATWGIWILAPIGALVAAVAAAAGRAWRACAPELPLLAAGSAFLLHNLFDFTAYLPAVALPAAVLLGAALAGREPRADPGRFVTRVAARIASVAGAVVLGSVLVVHGLAAARSESLLDRAADTIEAGRIDRAIALGRAAIDARPGDPRTRAFVAQTILAHAMEDVALRREGEIEAAAALALQPESAVLHHTRALYHRAAGETAAAYREQYAAHRLHPLEESYRVGAHVRPGEEPE